MVVVVINYNANKKKKKKMHAVCVIDAFSSPWAVEQNQTNFSLWVLGAKSHNKNEGGQARAAPIASFTTTAEETNDSRAAASGSDSPKPPKKKRYPNKRRDASVAGKCPSGFAPAESLSMVGRYCEVCSSGNGYKIKKKGKFDA